MRPVIDGHNDVLSRLHEEDADDTALLRDGTASVTVPSARAGGFAAGLFAVLPPPGPFEVERAAGGYEVPPFRASTGTSRPARTPRSRHACSGSCGRATDTCGWCVTPPTSTPAWPATRSA